MTNLIDRVAKAIYEASPHSGLNGLAWHNLPEEYKEPSREAARAAVTAMKDEEKPIRAYVEDGIEILSRLADGDTIVFSMDGDMAWFTKGDRAFVGDAIIGLREKGYLIRKHDTVDDEDDPRGIAFYDTISESGLEAVEFAKRYA